MGPAADIFGAAPENTLLLTDDFRQRYLRDDLDWQIDIRPRVEMFLMESVAKSSGRLRLILDVHASYRILGGGNSRSEVRCGHRTGAEGQSWSPNVACRRWQRWSGFRRERPRSWTRRTRDRRCDRYLTIYREPNTCVRGVSVASRRASRGIGSAGRTWPAKRHGRWACSCPCGASVEPAATSEGDRPGCHSPHLWLPVPTASYSFLDSSIKALHRVSCTSSTSTRRGDKTYQPSFVID